jgi:hypothetical protein
MDNDQVSKNFSNVSCDSCRCEAEPARFNALQNILGLLVYLSVGGLFHWILIGSTFSVSFVPGYVVVLLWPFILLAGLLGVAVVLGIAFLLVAAVFFGSIRIWQRFRREKTSDNVQNS